MTVDYQKLRLFGVYQQDKDDNLMLRVKIPAGFLTSDQAARICSLSEQFSNGILHLTTRGSIEFHWLRHAQLEELFTRLAEVGLTTRGACGGAVRGIACSTTFAPGFPVVQHIAQKLNRHFAGNPEFEGLPKKFKVGIDAGYQNSRYLIQDVGLVLVADSESGAIFDVWCAGGLGREPQAAFPLERGVAEQRLIHLIESVVQVYRDHTPPPKRLKYLLNTIGEAGFRKLLQAELDQRPRPQAPEVDEKPALAAPHGSFLEVPVFAGELAASRLRQLADLAGQSASGQLAVTANQNIALLATTAVQVEELRRALHQHAVAQEDPFAARFRVCPGNHECRMGLAPTRQLARRISTQVGPAGATLTWAISGCRNSCSQPQLADIGIVTKKLLTAADDSRQPLFDLYRRDGEGLGNCIGEELPEEALCSLLHTLY